MADRHEERRSSARIQDRILFSCSRLTEERFAKVRDDFQKGIPLYHQDGFDEIRMSLGTKNALAKLSARDRDLAEFLQHLDNKLTMVLEALRTKDGLSSPHLESMEVSLSGGGVAFFAKEEIESGTYLDLHIVLLPYHTHIYCIAKVVACEALAETREGEDPCYRIGTEFLFLMEEDREKIIHHSFRVQSLALRNRRLGALEP